MTPTRHPPTGPPSSAGVLAKYAQAYAREAGVSEGRVRAWISYMIMAGVLERAAVAAILISASREAWPSNSGYAIARAPRKTSMSCCNIRTPISRERSNAR